MIRLLLATPIAIACTLALFAFMAWMVDTSQRRTPTQEEALSFNMVMTESEQDIQRRKRTLPKQPKAPEVPQQAPVSQANTQQTQISPMAQPLLGLNTAIEGLAINAPQFSDFGVNQQVLPLYRAKPNYPSRALKRRLEGYVVMKFTINSTGQPVAIEVIESNPKGIFDREARRALSRWKYQPKTEDGRAVAQYGQTVKLEFEIEK